MKNPSSASLLASPLVNPSIEKRGEEEQQNSQRSFFENLKWLTAKEAAEYLRLSSVESLRNLVYKGKIPKYHLGRHLRFKTSDLDRVLEASANKRR